MIIKNGVISILASEHSERAKNHFSFIGKIWYIKLGFIVPCQGRIIKSGVISILASERSERAKKITSLL